VNLSPGWYLKYKCTHT